MNMTTKLNDESDDISLELNNCVDDLHIFVTLRKGQSELCGKFLIQELQHALRKLTVK